MTTRTSTNTIDRPLRLSAHILAASALACALAGCATKDEARLPDQAPLAATPSVFGASVLSTERCPAPFCSEGWIAARLRITDFVSARPKPPSKVDVGHEMPLRLPKALGEVKPGEILEITCKLLWVSSGGCKKGESFTEPKGNCWDLDWGGKDTCDAFDKTTTIKRR